MSTIEDEISIEVKYLECLNLDNSMNFTTESEIPIMFECYLYGKRYNPE